MNTENSNQEFHSDEITLKELILKIQEYFWELARNWIVIFALVILAGCYFFYGVFTTPKTFPASLKFMLNDDGGDKGGMSMILGSLGLGGMKGSGELASLEKIMQLFKTRAVIDQALLEPVDKNGKMDLLGNHMIDEMGFANLLENYGRASWSQQMDGLDDFKFHDSTSLTMLSEQQEIVLKILFDNIVGNPGREIDPIIASKLDENSEIITLSVVTETQELTLVMLETIYQKLSGFFIDKAIEKQKKTFDIISFKTDSIKRALTGAEYQLADFKDTNRKLVTVKGYLKETKLEREVHILNVMYAESIKNLEIADFALKRRQPYVQLIDFPMRPLSPSKPSKKNALIYSIALGILAGSIFIIARKIIRDALAS